MLLNTTSKFVFIFRSRLLAIPGFFYRPVFLCHHLLFVCRSEYVFTNLRMRLLFISNKGFGHLRSWSAIFSLVFIYSIHLVPYSYLVMVVICILRVTFIFMAPRYLIIKRRLNAQIYLKYYYNSTSRFVRFNKISLESEKKFAVHTFSQIWRSELHFHQMRKYLSKS